MRSLVARSLSTFMVSSFMALALAGCALSPEEKKKLAEERKANRVQYDDWVAKLGVAHRNVAALPAATLKDVPCDGPAMLAAAKEDTYLSLPTVHAPFLARFASTAPADWKDDAGPWSFLTEETFRSHFARHASARSASEVDGTARFVVNDWKKNRFLIVLRPDDERTNRLPLLRRESKSFDTGTFRGWFLIVDSADGRVVCQKRLVVESSANVTSGQTFNKDPQRALNKDFEDRFEAAIEAALPPKVKSSNNMGALLK